MPLTTYIGAFRLDGRDWFYLWQGDMEAGSFDTRVVRDEEHPRLFLSEAAARTVAVGLGLPVGADTPFRQDLDTLAAWCASPSSPFLQYVALGGATGILEDFGLLPFDPYGYPASPDGPVSGLHEKLICGMAVAQAPDPADPAYTRISPTWLPGERELLAAAIAQGLTRVRELLPR